MRTPSILVDAMTPVGRPWPAVTVVAVDPAVDPTGTAGREGTR